MGFFPNVKNRVRLNVAATDSELEWRAEKPACASLSLSVVYIRCRL